jgi:hypothetical protein
MGQNIRSSRGRFGSRTPGRVLSGPEVQPAEMPAPLAPTGLPAGRVPATKVAASGVAASAPLLRLCGREETDHRQQDRKDARRSHKEGNSSGHGLPTQGIRLYFTPGRWSGALCKCRYRLQGSGVFGGIPVSGISPTRVGMHCLRFFLPLLLIRSYRVLRSKSDVHPWRQPHLRNPLRLHRRICKVRNRARRRRVHGQTPPSSCRRCKVASLPNPRRDTHTQSWEAERRNGFLTVKNAWQCQMQRD